MLNKLNIATPFGLSARMPKNSNKPRIPEDDKRLLELKAAGKSNGAIGTKHGIDHWPARRPQYEDRSFETRGYVERSKRYLK